MTPWCASPTTAGSAGWSAAHEALRRQERAVPTGDLVHGGWMLRLGLRGVPFGSADRWA